MAHGYADDIDPDAFVIVNDKLYLNLTRGINRAWIRAGKRGIKSGDNEWPGIVGKLAKKGDYWND